MQGRARIIELISGSYRTDSIFEAKFKSKRDKIY